MTTTDTAEQIPTPASRALERKKKDEDAQLKKLQRLARRKKDSPFGHIGHTKKRAYVTALALTGMHGRACRVAGISRNTPYTDQWRDDQELQEAIGQAAGIAADMIEEELYRRGVEGVTKPTGWYKGVPGGYIQEYDTTAAIFLLKGLRPERYADRHDVRSVSVQHKIDYAALARTPEGQAIMDRIIAGEPAPVVIATAGVPVPMLESGQDKASDGVAMVSPENGDLEG
jgi:hypothetical protein